MSTPSPVPSFGIYIHVPWCSSRCPYCAFMVWVDRAAPYAAWGEAVRAEWALREGAWAARLGADGPPHSIYFGGGTPSLAPPEVILAVLEALPRGPETVVSLEVNPGSLDRGRLEELVAGGVNRMSLGLQTFTERHARLLNRAHTVGQARELASVVRSLSLESWNLDLIFGLPGQTLAELDADLDALLDLDPPHVSLYGLTYEEGTPLTAARDAGRVTELDEELWVEMYDRVVARLGDAGIERYEVSNFARPGHRSVHNEAVWRGGHYAGLGPSAHGFQPDGTRTVGHRDWARWTGDLLGEAELAEGEQAAVDFVLSTLRHVDGLPLDELARRFGFRVGEGTLGRLAHGGLAAVHGRALRLSHAGFRLADAVTGAVVEGLLAVDGAARG